MSTISNDVNFYISNDGFNPIFDFSPTIPTSTLT